MIHKLKRALKFVMREDPMIAASLGPLDKDGRIKVYDRSIPSYVEPRSIRVSVVGGDTPEGTYGDDHAILNKNFRVACWGKDEEDAGQLFQVVWDFFDRDIDLSLLNHYLVPWYVMSLSDSGDSLSLDDRETTFTQYVATYEIALGR